jgi:hypothetical protein
MRRHYESLNYLDGDPQSAMFRFSRSQGATSGVFAEYWTPSTRDAMSRHLGREQVVALRDMLTEILEDWK